MSATQRLQQLHAAHPKPVLPAAESASGGGEAGRGKASSALGPLDRLFRKGCPSSGKGRGKGKAKGGKGGDKGKAKGKAKQVSDSKAAAATASPAAPQQAVAQGSRKQWKRTDLHSRVDILCHSVDRLARSEQLDRRERDLVVAFAPGSDEWKTTFASSASGLAGQVVAGRSGQRAHSRRLSSVGTVTPPVQTPSSAARPLAVGTAIQRYHRSRPRPVPCSSGVPSLGPGGTAGPPRPGQCICRDQENAANPLGRYGIFRQPRPPNAGEIRGGGERPSTD